MIFIGHCFFGKATYTLLKMKRHSSINGVILHEMKKYIVLFVILFFVLRLSAQSDMKTDQGFMFVPHVAYNVAGADLQQRFENFASIGLGVDFKFKNNFVVGVDYDWFFGDNVKDNGIFSGIGGPTGNIIDENGDFAVIQLNMKGNYATANFGYLLNLPKSEPHSGVLFYVGAGMMQHRIDIVSSQVTIPQLNDDYEFGYDQMTYGFATKQYIGYQYLSEKNKLHLRLGIEYNQGFTQGRRTWDYNANTSGLVKRFDSTVALKLGLIVPVYTKKSEDEEFFID